MPRSFLVKKQQRSKKRAINDGQGDPVYEHAGEYFEGVRTKSTETLENVADDDNQGGSSMHYGGTMDYYQRATGAREHGLHALADICLLDIKKREQESQHATFSSSPQASRENNSFARDEHESERQFPEEVLRTLCLMRNSSADLKRLLAVPAQEGSNRAEFSQYGSASASSTGGHSSAEFTPSKSQKSLTNQKVDRELQKMLKGTQEVIQRELKDFLANNRFTEKEIVKETGLTIVDASRFLLDAWHTKEEKREIFLKWYLQKKMSKDDDSFTCYKCGKIFAYESYLERHVKYVCPDKTGRTWKCTYCVKAFQYPCYLRRHMRSHTGESPYKCTQCSRAFVRSTDLQRHLRNHTGEKPYKCQECLRAFARSTDLKRHMRTHTGEKPYKCWHCSKAFSQSGSLQTHLHTHYKDALQRKDMVTAERLKNSIRKKLISKVPVEKPT